MDTNRAGKRQVRGLVIGWYREQSSLEKDL